MYRKSLIFMSIFLMLFVVFSEITFAGNTIVNETTSKITLSPEEEKLLDKNFKELGIDSKTRKNLINKYKNGELIDAMNPEVLAKLPENALSVSLKNPLKKITFPDGSVLKLEVKVLKKTEMKPEKELKGDVSSQFYSSCGSGYCTYYEVLIDGTSGVQSAEFYADFTFVQGGADYISKVYDDRVMVIGGTYQNKSLSIMRQKEDLYYNRPAYAALTWDTISVGCGCSSYLKLFVEDDNYYSDGSM